MARIDDMIRQMAPDDPRLSEALVSEYFNFVYHLGCSILGDPSEADDAAQEAFIQTLRSLGRYQPGTNFKAWLARIAINTCRSRQRKARTRQMLQDALQLRWLHQPPREQTPEEVAILSEGQRGLHQAVEDLPEKFRLPVLLRYVHGMSVPEIANVLEAPEGTIHSRLHYAHRRLRQRLSPALLESKLTVEEER
jgi:RNA polymerase sigma-70 factor (ECF subfamily)